MSGSYWIVQTNNFMSISSTAVILGQGQQKALQYISLDQYFLYLSKIPRVKASTVLMRETKIVAVVMHAEDAAERNGKRSGRGGNMWTQIGMT